MNPKSSFVDGITVLDEFVCQAIPEPDSARELLEYCIYTIAHTDKLSETLGPVTLTEAKRWVSGEELWQQAQKQNNDLIVLFGDATDCSKLVAWGILTGIRLRAKSTQYRVDRIRKLKGPHSPQQLVLRRTGEPIAPHFIRPYAICKTPAFLRKNGQK